MAQHQKGSIPEIHGLLLELHYREQDLKEQGKGSEFII